MDAPEGVCVDTVTRVARHIPAAEWKKMRPFMLMVNAKYWTNIKIDWLKACRIAGPNCNVQVDSVDSAIQKLDQILKELFPN